MELEYKLAAIIGSCINEDQLVTARLCYIKAAETKKINIEQYHFLKKSADHKEQNLKDQMKQFELDRLTVDLHTDMSNSVDIFEVTPMESCGSVSALEDVSLTAENVAKVASTLTLK